jgi:thiamine-phosphate pyrophosphorylase
MASQRPDETRPAPRLYLVTPLLADPSAIAEGIDAALRATDVAAVLVRLADDSESTLIKRVKALGPAIQNAGAALILDNRADLVARAGADGAHLTGIAEFEAAVGSLKPDRIAGAGGVATRHDAMLAAEHGADYVMFGEPGEDGVAPPFEQTLERIAWWQEVFQTPCVGYAASLDDVGPLAQAGADFVALGDFVFGGTRPVSQAVMEAAALLTAMEAAS